VGARSWNAWRRRRDKTGPLVSSEAKEVSEARGSWRKYQRETEIGNGDPVRVKQLALEMWRARAIDSRSVAEIKDRLSVLAALAFLLALAVTAYLVGHARFVAS
jgi:hypothetical protein